MSPNHLPAQKLSYAKRFVALGLTVTIGFSVVLAMVLWDSRDGERERSRQAATNVIATIASDIERNLELYDLSLQAVVDAIKLPSLSQMDPETRQLVLFDRAATAKDMGSILVLDTSGNVLFDSRSLTPRADNYAKADYFIVQEQNPLVPLYVSRPWRDPSGEYLIAISRRLSNEDGSFFGVVVGTLRLNYFRNLFGKVGLGDGDTLTLVRHDGSILMRSPMGKTSIGQSLAASPTFRRIVSDASGSFENTAKIDGIDRLYVYQRVAEHPLIISFGLSIDTIYAGWLRKAWIIGLLALSLCATNIALILSLAGALKRRSEAENQLSIAATTDGLTGLCNRRRLDEIFELEWRRAMRTETPVALLMIDADGFKAYNDQFGHQRGDTALAAIANCIRSSTQRASDVAARYGGEEFAILMPGMSLAEAVKSAETIRACVMSLRADQQDRPDRTPTVSIGAASMVPLQGLQPRDLINAADTALYQAKTNGRNRTEPILALNLVGARHRNAAA